MLRKHMKEYLEVLAKAPFSPIGSLYTNLFDGLVAKGLVRKIGDEYVLSDEGRAYLAWLQDENEPEFVSEAPPISVAPED